MILLKWDWALLLSYSLPSVVYVHTPKKLISQYQPFSSNIKKRKQGSDVFSTNLHDTLAYTAGKNKMIWFRLSVGETRPCTSVQHGATETVSSYLNAFVCSAVFCRVCQCKISAKYGCSVTIALDRAATGTGHRCTVCIYLSFDVDCVAYIVGLLVITRTSVQPWTLICLREYSGAKLR